jgi:tetratricopeptide (TPR) repeat protein
MKKIIKFNAIALSSALLSVLTSSVVFAANSLNPPRDSYSSDHHLSQTPQGTPKPDAPQGIPKPDAPQGTPKPETPQGTPKPDAIAAFKQGVEYAQKKDLANAEKSFRTAIQIDDTFAEAHAHLGRVLAMQKNFNDALTQFEIAAKLKPNAPIFQYYVGVVLFELKRPQEAAVALKKTRDLLKAQGKTKETETLNRILKENGLE